MSKKSPLFAVIAAVFALCLMVASPALAHHDPEHAQGGGSDQAPSEQGSDNGSENTPGNDRKEGYEDNSSEPQEPNHGHGSDRDGDAGNDAHAYTEDDDTDAGGNKTNSQDTTRSSHPSGKDRFVENGGSGNQGRSESNPDDSKGPMRYEGPQGDDKPNGPGGTDVYDQDGNNGCGNDQDFDDDNNGWCGKPVKPVNDNKPCDADATMPGIQKCETPPANVLPGRVDQPVKPCDKDNNMANGVQPCNEVLPIELDLRPATPAQVLGIRVSKAPAVAAAVQPAVAAQPAVAGAVLPFTGGDVLVFLAAAFGLILAGLVSLKVRRTQ